MSSGLGYPDWQKIQQWLGAPLDEATAAAIGAGAINLGPYNLASWASIVVAIKPTGGKVTVTVKQKISGGPATLELDSSFVVAAAATVFEAIVLFGDVVSITLQGDTVGETVDYAVYPSNTTTNAQLSSNPSIGIQHNAVIVASEPAIDFEDAGANVWTVADDAANSRVKVTPPRVITGRINADGTIASGSGFTVTKTGAGGYQINFTVAFAATPAFIATSRTFDNNHFLSAESASSISINWYNGSASANADKAFDFIAFALT